MNGEFYDEDQRNICLSSEGSEYTAEWHYRESGWSEDPWISINDHDLAKNTPKLLYGEGDSMLYAGPMAVMFGSYVFIRKVPELSEFGCKIG